MDTSSLNSCTDSAHISNDSGSPNRERNEPLFYTQDKEILSILKEQVQSTTITDSDRISGYFCSNTDFNLSKKVLPDMEIKILEKGLDYTPIQNKINKPECLRRDFKDFARRMRLKWYFRNDPTSSFSECPSFTPKSSWKPPKGTSSLKLFSKSDSHLLKKFVLFASKKCFICFNERPLKMMENVFYFFLKALFILKIFKFLSQFFGHIEKIGLIRNKVNFKIYDVTTWLTNNYNIQILPNISRSKEKKTMKFGQLIEYNKRNIVL